MTTSLLLAAGLISSVAAGAAVPSTGLPAGGQPGWHLQTGSTDPGGRTVVGPDGRVTVQPRPAQPAPLAGRSGMPPGRFPGCLRSPVCGRIGSISRQAVEHVVWDQATGYGFSYPFQMPPGPGGVPGAGVDSKGNVWVFQRKPKDMPQLFKFDPQGHLLITVSPDVIGYQEKAHAIAVDRHDNVWISDATGATVMQLSPDGRLLKTIGTKDRRGDWDESKGQHLLWQPVSIAFGPNGDTYIGEGHGNESPNDVDSDDPANNIGAARIMHFDPSGNFVDQWFGNDVGQGKFEQTHGLGVDPTTGDVWIGDREQYRIVIYTSDGKFLRTIQMRNLVCAIAFDPQGNPWIASGQDGQILRIDRTGKILAAIGAGPGIDPGKFIEAAFFAFDRNGVMHVGDTSIGRVARIAPEK
jgi:sugar lactone lactonase YvrE